MEKIQPLRRFLLNVCYLVHHKKSVFNTAIIILLLFSPLADAAFNPGPITEKVLSVTCGIYRLFFAIAGFVASLIFVIAGVKWIASENDPGSRKAAKDTMVNAIVGLIIVSVTGAIVTAVATYGRIC